VAKVTERYHTFHSTYEVMWDEDMRAGYVRRLGGDYDPTKRQGPDGAWRRCQRILKIGSQFFFDWAGDGRGTMTSAVLTRVLVSGGDSPGSGPDVA